MYYEKPEMRIIESKEKILTVVIVSGDVTEGGGLPDIDLSGQD